ncbi:hypothetical protein SAMD00019534_076930 [Acytostelium subglobosum LB1]|uniref:hypothetical protein n=1 Tax=Acytostelium subglobosum LB1 TaxID=1410327 RepID=UPI000644F68D|nr:hypothetical protein SAMD00019534_076930 [Acytostelium subglobosum LB1]GAM24518.1 hypothetical protein SAMD00019534_076930 [Acytostelium subglobosum LB1]|eukprot:XP_012752844.1 hypothetical protein SAMD00019534_076930 [Acytostelium subglobosum LB1]
MASTNQPQDTTTTTVSSTTDTTSINTSTGSVPIIAPHTKFSLDVLNIAQTSQIQNGLRQKDYTRYRQYCTRRLGRVRSTLKKHIGKKNYIAKLNDSKNIIDFRYLLIVLIKTERAWAYANALKNDYEQQDAPRLKVHMNSRFAKAAVHAAQLERFCKEVADAYTQVEATAYASFIKSANFMSHQQWLEALEEIIVSKTLYEEMAAHGTPTLRDLYTHRVEDAEPTIRYCMYNLRNLDGGSASSTVPPKVAAAAKARTDPLVSSIKSTGATSTSSGGAAPMSTISWRSRQVRVSSEKVRERLVAQDQLVKEQSSIKVAEEAFQMYEKIVKHLLDAEVIVRNEVVNIVRSNITTKTVKSENEEADLKALLAYITYQKFSQLYKRNQALLNAYLEVLESGAARDQGIVKIKKSKVTYRDVVRIYTNQVKVFGKMIENRNETRPDPTLDAQLQVVRAARLHYISVCLAGTKKWSESMATLERSQTILAAAKKTLANKPNLAEVLKTVQQLEAGGASVKSQVHANAFIQQISSDDGLKKQMSELSLQSIGGGGGAKSEGQQQDLISGLDNFDTGFLAEKRLVDCPPLQPVPTKPLFFDLAFNQCQFPSLEARKKATSKGLFGFWGR